MTKPRDIFKILIFVISLCLIFFIIYRLFFFIDATIESDEVKRDNGITRLNKSQWDKLKDGDVILRRGYGYFSDIISHYLNDSVFDVTHCGILYKDNGNWFVIHSLSSDVSNIDGVQRQSLKDFLKYSYPHKILVTSANNITPKQREEVVKRAKYYLDIHTPFDHYGVIDDASKLYCTELVWQIFGNDLHIMTLPKNTKDRKKLFSSMIGMYNPKYFDIVINTYPKFKNGVKSTKHL